MRTPPPASIGPVGDSVKLADELMALVLSGRKRATCGAVAEYDHDREQLPRQARGRSPPIPGLLFLAPSVDRSR